MRHYIFMICLAILHRSVRFPVGISRSIARIRLLGGHGFMSEPRIEN